MKSIKLKSFFLLVSHFAALSVQAQSTSDRVVTCQNPQGRTVTIYQMKPEDSKDFSATVYTRAYGGPAFSFQDLSR